MQIHVGQTSLQKGGFQKYAQKLSFLELLAEPVRLPKLSQLKEIGREAPEGFVFSVVLSERSLREDEEGQKLRAYGLKVAQAVNARWVVLRTPATVRPSTQSEQRIAKWVRALEAEGVAVAWEPRGVWDGRRALQLAEKLGIQLVQDVSDIRPGKNLYIRIAGLGTAQRVGESLVERLAVKLEGAENVFVAVASPGAIKVRELLEELFEPWDDGFDAEALGGSDADLDDELDADDDDDEHGFEDDEDDLDDDTGANG